MEGKNNGPIFSELKKNTENQGRRDQLASIIKSKTPEERKKIIEALQGKTHEEMRYFLDRENEIKKFQKDLELAMQNGYNIDSYIDIAIKKDFLKDAIPSFQKGLELAMQNGNNIDNHINIAINKDFLKDAIPSFQKGLELVMQNGNNIDNYINIAIKKDFLKDADNIFLIEIFQYITKNKELAIFIVNNRIYNKLSKEELEKIYKFNGDQIKELEKILNKKNNSKDLLGFRINNIFREDHKEIFNNFKTYLEERGSEYLEFIESWKIKYLEENKDKKESDFYLYVSTLNYVKPEKFNSLDIIYKYLPKDKKEEGEYHIPLEKISNLKIFDKLQIQDMYQLLGVLLPNSNPNDFGKDKYEIFGTLVKEYLSPNFLQNFIEQELTEEQRKDGEYISKFDDIEFASKIVSEIFHEKGYFKDFLELYKKVRLYSSFTKEDYLKLDGLKEKDENIHQYFIDLLTHESASIDGLKTLLNNPEKFFNNSSSFSDYKLHQSLNPNNWHEIGDDRLDVEIDLNAEDIRDISVGSKLDTRSYLNIDGIKVEKQAILTSSKKAELLQKNKENIELINSNLKEYLNNNFDKQILEDIINIIFTNYSEIKNTLNLRFDGDNKYLLNNIKKLIENKTLILNNKYKNIFDDLNNLNNKELFKLILEKIDSKDLEDVKKNEIEKLSDYSSIGSDIKIRGEFLRFDDYRRATVGNDSGSCDSFSDGKRNLYNSNPSCFQFSISFQDENRKNVIFQSLVTIDYDVKDKEIIEKLKKGISSGNISKELGEDFLERFYANTKPVICFDNVEGNKQFRDKIVLEDSHIGEIYKEIFKELVKQNSQINPNYFIVGKTGLNDSKIDAWLSSSRKNDIENSFIPSTLLSYIDNRNSECHRINIDNQKLEKPERQNGVFEISYLDSIPVMYLEDKIHQDVEKEGGIAIQNTLIGSHYSFVKNNIENMNTGYFDNKGVLRGYAIAYPSINMNNNEKCIYIHDLAIQEKYRDKSGELIIVFMKKISEQSKILLQQTDQDRIYIKSHTNKFSSVLLKHASLAKRFGIIINGDKVYIEK